MKFAATLSGITPKDSQAGKTIEVKLTMLFDSALFAQLGDCFGDRVAIAINDPQLVLEFASKADETKEEV